MLFFLLIQPNFSLGSRIYGVGEVLPKFVEISKSAWKMAFKKCIQRGVMGKLLSLQYWWCLTTCICCKSTHLYFLVSLKGFYAHTSEFLWSATKLRQQYRCGYGKLEYPLEYHYSPIALDGRVGLTFWLQCAYTAMCVWCIVCMWVRNGYTRTYKQIMQHTHTH